MKWLLYWGPPLALMSLIFYLSSRSTVSVSQVYALQFLFYKTLHVLEYATLYVLLYRALRNTTDYEEWQHRFHGATIAIFYGISDEIHQMFTPHRTATIRDTLIDACAIIIVSLLLWKLLPKAPKKLKPLVHVLGLA